MKRILEQTLNIIKSMLTRKLARARKVNRNGRGSSLKLYLSTRYFAHKREEAESHWRNTDTEKRILCQILDEPRALLCQLFCPTWHSSFNVTYAVSQTLL